MYLKLLSLFFLLFSLSAWAKPISIVAAENFYGDIAKQIGGIHVTVTNIINHADQDPHLFSSKPSTAKAVANADLIIYNGLDYDTWMKNLLTATHHKIIIVIATLMNKQAGDNPHLWYDPNTMLVYAKDLTEKLGQLDPTNRPYYQKQFSAFNHKYQKFLKKISTLKQKHQGTPIIATEPIFTYMTDALGLKIYGEAFQLNIMNETSPRIKDIQDFEDKLNKHLVKILIYNNQVTNPITTRMKKLAETLGIPIVGVSETQPANQDYLGWMNEELFLLEAALNNNPRR